MSQSKRLKPKSLNEQGVQEFINNLLSQFCPLKRIQNIEECRTLLAAFFPISDEKQTMKALKHLEKNNLVDLWEPFELVMSSGENLILIYPGSGIVLKIFGKSANLKPELEASKKFSKILVPMRGCINQETLRAIAYKQLVPISQRYLSNLSPADLYKLLQETAKAYDTLHLSGYIHGDPGHSNIAYDAMRDRYVLMDLEDITKPRQNLGEKAYQEIVQLLEDLSINAQNQSHSQFLKKLLQAFVENNTTVKSVTRSFLGKDRTRNIVTAHYKPGEFCKFLQRFWK